jgi:hypothetical protein
LFCFVLFCFVLFLSTSHAGRFVENHNGLSPVDYARNDRALWKVRIRTYFYLMFVVSLLLLLLLLLL